MIEEWLKTLWSSLSEVVVALFTLNNMFLDQNDKFIKDRDGYINIEQIHLAES